MRISRYLLPEALVHAQGLGTEQVPDAQSMHEIGQVYSPHTLCELQLLARTAEVFLTHWMQVPDTHTHKEELSGFPATQPYVKTLTFTRTYNYTDVPTNMNNGIRIIVI